jgi:hypothetical protein
MNEQTLADARAESERLSRKMDDLLAALASIGDVPFLIDAAELEVALVHSARAATAPLPAHALKG